MRLDLTAPSVNSHWHVPHAIQSLIGETYLARRNFDIWQPYLAQRIEKGDEHAFERGIATSLIIQVSLVAERSIKTLLAQTDPSWNGVKEHDLIILYRQLDYQDRRLIQAQFDHPNFASNWLKVSDEKQSDVESLIDTAKRNFVDWRYSMERKRTGGGIPGPLLKASAAVNLVCIWHLLRAQQVAPLVFPIDDLPFDVIGELI